MGLRRPDVSIIDVTLDRLGLYKPLNEYLMASETSDIHLHERRIQELKKNDRLLDQFKKVGHGARKKTFIELGHHGTRSPSVLPPSSLCDTRPCASYKNKMVQPPSQPWVLFHFLAFYIPSSP